MKQRCLDTSNKNYASYGARGIKICDEWLSFKTFYADVGDIPFEGATLERLDTQGNYEKSNIAWADAKTQANNRRSSVRFMYKEKLHSLSELSEISGISSNTLRARLCDFNWPVEMAVETPLLSKQESVDMQIPKFDVPVVKHKLYPPPHFPQLATTPQHETH